MRDHDVGVLRRAAGFENDGDGGGAKCMTTDPDLHAKPRSQPSDHTPGVNEVMGLLTDGLFRRSADWTQ
jgi:hypothetical protein